MIYRVLLGAVILAGGMVACGSGTGSGPDGGGKGGSASGGSASAGAPGRGGTGGIGSGATGGSATGGVTGAGGAASGCWPACIANAQAGCWRPTTGSCTYAIVQGGGDTYCYSNGVTEAVDALNKTHTFSNASGTCFSYMNTSQPASATMTFSYKDGAGNEVAQATSDDGGLTLMITCGGQTYTLDTSSAACTTLTPNSCTSGSCSGH